MPEDINHLDTNDEGLKGIFGNRWHDETDHARYVIESLRESAERFVEEEEARRNEARERYNVAAISKKETPTKCKEAKVAQKPMYKPVEPQWQPTKENTWYDNLKACAIWALVFGLLTFIFFSWQQKGLMDASVALPSMLVCAALFGWGVGKNAMRGTRR